MIKLESAHIEEVRGIRNLDLAFRKEKFAISGPNGSGKSGVIDAIEFGLTGHIGRLTGSGTKGLSVSEHGPHVDKTKFPDAAFVELRVTGIGKSATITRKVTSPRSPRSSPLTMTSRLLSRKSPTIRKSRFRVVTFSALSSSNRPNARRRFKPFSNSMRLVRPGAR